MRKSRPRLLPLTPQTADAVDKEGHITETSEGDHRRHDIKPAIFDGSGSWLDYKTHFDACAGGFVKKARAKRIGRFAA